MAAVKSLMGGSSGVDFANVQRVLDEYAVAVRNAYQDNLIRSDRIASGNLLNNAEYKVTRNGTEFVVSLSLVPYWKYIEYGTKPHWPPPDKILEWIKIKPVIPRPDKEGKIPSPQSLAYLISRAISKNGTKGSNDLTDALRDINPMYADAIAEALRQDTAKIVQSFITDFRPKGAR